MFSLIDFQNLEFWIIHSVEKYLLNTRFVPGRWTKNPSLCRAYILVVESDNEQIIT